MRILLLGATGTIGRATAAALSRRGHEVIGLVRRAPTDADWASLHITTREGDVTSAGTWPGMFRGPAIDAVVSCLASRTGEPRDAWAIDHGAHALALESARNAGVSHFVLLSAICVQKPKLAFQHAKLAFEKGLQESGLCYSIVRPTAFFKSLSGQVARVRRGKSFLVFGDGTLTACKPISDRDLAEYLADCLVDPARRNRILPIGGPGPAITSREQGERLFALLGKPARFTQVPVGFLDAVVAGLSVAAKVVPPLAAKAEYARIGRYYATESMLVWDAARGRYDADATPSTGGDTLFEHYETLLRGSLMQSSRNA